MSQCDREVERLRQNLKNYRRQLASSTDRRLELSNYREVIEQRENEIIKQIEKAEVSSRILEHTTAGNFGEILMRIFRRS